jgi:hypothetical protein
MPWRAWTRNPGVICYMDHGSRSRLQERLASSPVAALVASRRGAYRFADLPVDVHLTAHLKK